MNDSCLISQFIPDSPTLKTFSTGTDTARGY